MREAFSQPMRTMGLAAIAALLAGAPAYAQDADAPRLKLELNALQPVEAGCRLTFVVENGFASTIDKAGYELAFFDTQGLVSRLTAVEFLDLPAGRARVRQFQFSGQPCDQIARILVNASTECAGEGIEPAACLDALETANRTAIEFGA
jgi:hypothetical protein